MRICFVCGNLHPLLAAGGSVSIVGGAEVQQDLIARALRRAGFETCFVTEDFGQGPVSHVEGGPVFAYRFGKDKLRQGVTLWRALERADANLYYVRGVPKFIGLLAFFSVLRRRPLVLAMSFDQAVLPRRRTGLSLPVFLSYRWALSRAAAVVAQTETQRAALASNHGVRGAILIPNAVASEPPPPAGRQDRSTVVWIASLHPRKGIENLFDLSARLPGLRFEVVGGPARGQLAYYEERRADAARCPNLVWRGPLPHAEIDGVLAGALALVHTGVTLSGAPTQEGFPNIYLEAWKNGVPVLTLHYDPDGVITRTGFGCRCGTIERMAAELERLAADPALRGRIAASARGYVRREHDADRIVGMYKTLFDDILEGG